jgi:hypothetical protein
VEDDPLTFSTERLMIMSLFYNAPRTCNVIFVVKDWYMQQSLKTNNRASTNSVTVFYAIGIIGNLLISLVHIAYAVATFETVDEPALWFFSGALSVIFNAALNLLCFKEYTKRNYLTSMAANVSLFIFIVVLCFVVREAQTISIAIVMFYTTALCYLHGRQRQNMEAQRAAS